uniref:Uncharacterized protein n=1 Tax=Polynucleobacter necessarius subsp. necessarius (strain STIR1) TaxID=452638 RepID=B1XUI3_POLNS
MKVSPIRLIRQEFEVVNASTFWTIAFGLIAALTLIMIAARDWKLASKFHCRYRDLWLPILGIFAHY